MEAGVEKEEKQPLAKVEVQTSEKKGRIDPVQLSVFGHVCIHSALNMKPINILIMYYVALHEHCRANGPHAAKD